jgi:hypothetical protein
VLVKVCGVVEATLCCTVVGTDCGGPSCLAVPDLGHITTSDLLDVGDGLVHVVKVDVSYSKVSAYFTHNRHSILTSVVAAGALPEGKGVDHNNIRCADDGVTGTVGELVPRICSANLHARGQRSLDGLDLALELVACEVAAIHGLGTDCDGIDGIIVLLSDVGNGFEV